MDKGNECWKRGGDEMRSSLPADEILLCVGS